MEAFDQCNIKDMTMKGVVELRDHSDRGEDFWAGLLFYGWVTQG